MGKRTRSNGMGTAYKRGKTWTASITIGWKGDPPIPIKRTKGGFKTKKEALEYCPYLRGTITKQKNKELTFIKLYEKMIDRHMDRVSHSTINCYKAAFKYYEPIHYLKFADLTTESLQTCVDMCDKGKRTKENMKALGTLMYSYALENDIVSTDYAKHLWIKNEEAGSYNAFTPEHLEKILNAGLAGDDNAAIIACACYLGFRPTALINLKKSDYNTKEKTLTGGIKTTAGMDRVVPISKKIQPLIDRLMQKDGEYLFANNGKQFTQHSYRKQCFYPCLDNLGIQKMPVQGEDPYYKPYSCRHTFATKLKSVDGNMKDKAALMGHTSYEMTLKYQHEDNETKRAIIDQL